MDLGLKDRRALVLGASRGLGAAIARTLAEEGAHVIAAARGEERIKAWIAALPEESRARVRPMPLDLADAGSVDRLAEVVLAEGGVDILVANSGGPPPAAARDATLEQWRTLFQPMAAHLFHLTGRLLPAMVARRWGRIIVIGSSGVEQPIANLALSNGIRAAVAGWAKTLAGEVAAQGVTVNLALPGRIQTERVDELDAATAQREGGTPKEAAAAAAASIPAGRYGHPQEFADVVAFLASERAAYVTGTMVRVDGGLVRGI